MQTGNSWNGSPYCTHTHTYNMYEPTESVNTCIDMGIAHSSHTDREGWGVGGYSFYTDFTGGNTNYYNLLKSCAFHSTAHCL